jgi:hypothetical protein
MLAGIVTVVIPPDVEIIGLIVLAFGGVESKSFNQLEVGSRWFPSAIRLTLFNGVLPVLSNCGARTDAE